MPHTTHFTIRLDENLKEKVQKTAKEKFGIGLGTLTKLFFQSFVGKQKKIIFYVGDETFDERLNEILETKRIKTALKKLGKSV